MGLQFLGAKKKAKDVVMTFSANTDLVCIHAVTKIHPPTHPLLIPNPNEGAESVTDDRRPPPN